MSKYEKLIKSLSSNPRADWRIEDLKRIADKLNIDYRQLRGSHVTFRTSSGDKLTVPAHKPIKEVYIKMFIEFIKKKEKRNE